MPSATPIAEAWESFLAEVVHGCDAQQVAVMRRVFFAGAIAILRRMDSAMDKSGTEEMTDAEAQYLENLDAEMERYIADQQKSRRRH